jgi:hypothetical protein
VYRLIRASLTAALILLFVNLGSGALAFDLFPLWRAVA